MPVHKRVLLSERLRILPEEGFSWIDRRFFRNGYAERLNAPQVLLYLFLCSIADREGLSFYGDRRICDMLGIEAIVLDQARRALIHADLLAYCAPLYQVLSLPSHPREVDQVPAPGSTSWTGTPTRTGSLHCAAEIFKEFDRG